MAAERPHDECPYQRPLDNGFDRCPAFHPLRYVPMTVQFAPMKPVLACRHMKVGLRDGGAGRAYYCRCDVGDAEARARLGHQIGERRGRLMRELADGLMDVVAAHADALGEAKGRELSSVGVIEHRQASHEVAAAAAVISAEMHTLVEGRLREHVRELGIRPSALGAVIDAGIRDFEANGFANWTPPEELLSQLPADVAAFLRPPSSPPAA